VSEVVFAPPAWAEGLRRRLAPPVALLAALLGTCCMLSIVGVARSRSQLSVLDDRFVGWVGVGAGVAIAAVAAALLAADRVGSGPFLALGALASVFGLSLARHVDGSEQLTLAIVACGLAVGALLGGGFAMASTLPQHWARAAVSAWALPLVVVSPLLTRAVGGDRPGGFPDLVVHPPTWMLGVVTVLLAAWGVLTMLVEPVPVRDPASASWDDAWSAVLLLSAAAVLLTALLGFDPQISLVWLRPVVVLTTAALVTAWLLAGLVIPDLQARLAYLSVSAVAWVVPSTTAFALGAANGGGDAVGWPILGLLVAAAVVGAVVGSRGLVDVLPIGFTLTAVAAAAAWVMSDQPWVMVAAVGPLVALATAIVVTGVRIIGSDQPASRLVAFAVIVSLVLGQLVAVPLDWAMLGDVPDTVGATMASGRLDVGLTVAVTALAGAWTWVARGRLLRRQAAGSVLTAAQHGSAVDLQDLASGEAGLL
jgi:hypothetical protein